MDVFCEISNLISNYFANKKIKLDAILNFYKKFEEFNFKDEDLSFVLNDEGNFWCKKCKSEYKNIANIEVFYCPECEEPDKRRLLEKLLNDSIEIIRKENLVKGPYYKSWYELFQCSPKDRSFVYKEHLIRSKETSKLYDDSLYRIKILTLGDYLPRYKYAKNEETEKILALKDCQDDSIMEFTKKLNHLVSKNAILCTVPSSEKNKISGMDKIVFELCKLEKARVNLSGFPGADEIFPGADEMPLLVMPLLYRVKSVPKQRGTRRPPKVEDETVNLNQKLIKMIGGKSILLLDDITTSGNTFNVHYDKLKNAGANKIFCLALGKTKK